MEGMEVRHAKSHPFHIASTNLGSWEPFGRHPGPNVMWQTPSLQPHAARARFLLHIGRFATALPPNLQPSSPSKPYFHEPRDHSSHSWDQAAVLWWKPAVENQRRRHYADISCLRDTNGRLKSSRKYVMIIEILYH